MTTSNSIPSTFSPTPSSPRATAPSAGTSFRNAFVSAAMGAIDTLVSVAPGGLAANAAVRLASNGTASSVAPGGGTLGATGSVSSGVDQSAQQAFDLLALQQQIGDEQRRFTTVSNVMKARHDTAKNVLGNVR